LYSKNLQRREEKDHLGEPCVVGRKILKWMLKMMCEYMNGLICLWIGSSRGGGWGLL
jgi:hypothetical protein